MFDVDFFSPHGPKPPSARLHKRSLPSRLPRLTGRLAARGTRLCTGVARITQGEKIRSKKKVRAVRLNVASVRKKRHNDGTVGTRSAKSAKLFISFLFSLSVLLPASGFFPPSFNPTVIHLFHNFLPFLNRLFVA